MSNQLAGLTAIAWSLFAAKTKGNRVYRIMLLDNYVVVGAGPDADHLTLKVYKFADAPEARAYAVKTTARLERAGFAIHHEPRSKVANGGSRTWLDGLVGQRSYDRTLRDSINTVLTTGELLEKVAA